MKKIEEKFLMNKEKFLKKLIISNYFLKLLQNQAKMSKSYIKYFNFFLNVKLVININNYNYLNS